MYVGVAPAGGVVVSGSVADESVPEVMSESGTAVGLVAASEKDTVGGAEPDGAAEIGGLGVGTEVTVDDCCLGTSGLWAAAKRGAVMAVRMMTLMKLIGEVKTVFGGYRNVGQRWLGRRRLGRGRGRRRVGKERGDL